MGESVVSQPWEKVPKESFPKEWYPYETTLVVIEPKKGKPCFLFSMNQIMQKMLTFTWSSSHESTFHMQSKDYDMELV